MNAKNHSRIVPRRAREIARAAIAVTLSGALAVLPACSPQAPARPATQVEALAPVGQGFNLNASDLRFILQQIKIAENHVVTGQMFGTGPNQIPNVMLPWGLRTVDGRFNNIVPGQSEFGAADRIFPRLTARSHRDAEVTPPQFGPPTPTSYTQKSGNVFDSQPRVISNLIVDQTLSNPSAVAAAGFDPVLNPPPPGTLFIPNVAPDVGLSAPFNSIFTFFGQFFDHGLDLVTKGGSGTVFVPLRPGDDPLFDNTPGAPNFMVITRATNLPGPDGILGNDNDIQEGTNTTTPFVDQNQTYTSHPSHQVFLRHYELVGGRPFPTGRLIDGALAGNIGNWGEVKAQARDLLGIELTDMDVFNVPLLAVDYYGHFIPGPSGFPQVVFPGNELRSGSPAVPLSVVGSLKTGHAFLDDIAHHAVPSPTRTPDADPGTADDGIPTTYDDEMLARHFVTGDGRGNENIGLTSIHTIFHSEHNRLRNDIDQLIHTPGFLTAAEVAEWEAVSPAPPLGTGWRYGERLFQAARFVTEMEYQHLVFEEFARKVQPMINLFAGYHTEIDPAIAAEFAHAVYRFGHSMLTETVARVNPAAPGAVPETNDIPLLAAFLNPPAFNDGGPLLGQVDALDGAGSIFRGMTRQVANEIDEFVTEALRNNLLGLPLDLATINMARARSEGIARLNAARRTFYEATFHPWLVPYDSWAEFQAGLRHQESLVNFVAAYGTHPSVLAATTRAEKRAAAALLVAADPVNPATPADALDFMAGTGAWATLPGQPTITGVDDVDLWVGGLAEKQAPFGGLLGSTFNYVFETQLEKLQDGDRLYYLSRTAGLNLLVQLEGNSFAELVMRNVNVEGLPADAFSRPDFIFNVLALGASGPITDDPTTELVESTLPDLFRMPDGTIRFVGPEHVVFNGRDDAADRIWSSEGDDTLRGNGGNDVMEGGAGNDNFIGGLGNDILTDAFGDDVLKGGDGNDALSSGPGFDLNQGGRGHDFIVGGSDPTETFGGPGNDIIYAGDSADTVFGDDGDDWIEGGGQADLLQGDNGAPFQDDPNAPGNDVIIGDGGDDDYDSEGGDDVMVAGPGIERNEGMLGFDWVTYARDPQPGNADMRIPVFQPPAVDALRDRFDLVEGLSGGPFADTLHGNDADVVLMVGHELVPAGVARIAGLQALLRGAVTFTGGNIIIGGPGSDLIEGRGGDDLIDGDAMLTVQLRAPDPATPGAFRLVDSLRALQVDVFAGRLDPGDISIVRTISTAGALAADVDTAVFSGDRAEYLITVNADGTVTVDHQGGVDGVDTLRNMELLAFLDQTIPVPTNQPATGTVIISDATPAENQLLTVTDTIQDADGVNRATLVFTWQVETAPGVFADVATGTSFAPTDAQVGRRLRVVATFFDQNPTPNQETVVSAPTSPVTPVNDPPTGLPTLSDTTPQIGAQLSAVTTGIADADGLGAFAFQWRANGLDILNARGVSFTPTSAQSGQTLSVRVTYTDGQGTVESLTSTESAPVAAPTGPIVQVLPTFNFNVRRVNNSTIAQINVTNVGIAPLTVVSVTSSGAPFINPTRGTCNAPLVPGASCRVGVTFRPTTVGTFTGTLTITSNATNSPTLVALTGAAR